MRILIVEDDYISRKFMLQFLSPYGECDVTVDGWEAIEVFMQALDEKNYYDMVCLDVMMPEVSGIKVLKTLRKLEIDHGVQPEYRAKIIMTTALDAVEEVLGSFECGSDAYSVKPIDMDKFIHVMARLGLTTKVV